MNVLDEIDKINHRNSVDPTHKNHYYFIKVYFLYFLAHDQIA